MKSITIRLDDDLFTWIHQQAQLTHRSKNQHIQHLLEQARRIPLNTQESRYILTSNLMCYNGRHHFRVSDPAMADMCNCGVFMFGEIKE